MANGEWGPKAKRTVNVQHGSGNMAERQVADEMILLTCNKQIQHRLGRPCDVVVTEKKKHHKWFTTPKPTEAQPT